MNKIRIAFLIVCLSMLCFGGCSQPTDIQVEPENEKNIKRESEDSYESSRVKEEPSKDQEEYIWTDEQLLTLSKLKELYGESGLEADGAYFISSENAEGTKMTTMYIINLDGSISLASESSNDYSTFQLMSLPLLQFMGFDDEDCMDILENRLCLLSQSYQGDVEYEQDSIKFQMSFNENEYVLALTRKTE